MTVNVHSPFRAMCIELPDSYGYAFMMILNKLSIYLNNFNSSFAAPHNDRVALFHFVSTLWKRTKKKHERIKYINKRKCTTSKRTILV